MHSSANCQRKSRSWLACLAGALAIGFTYFWILPLFRPRGDFLWGHYRLKDIYLGIPLAIVTPCALMIIAAPARYRRALSLRVATSTISILLVLSVCDVGYAFVVMGALRPNLWLDHASISRAYSGPDNELGFVRKPDVSWQRYLPDVNRTIEYHTDENGFRNPPQTQRADIVFIGDSYTEAATVAEEDTFVRRLGQLTGLSVVNLGRGAYGAPQEQIVLRRYGLSYKPRVVVWQLFEGNDLSDAEVFSNWKQNPHPLPTSLKERYFNNSLLNQLLTNTRSRVRAQHMATLQHPDGTAIRLKLRHGYNPDQPSTMHLGMNETMAAIDDGQRLCKSRGIQMVVVYVPTMVRVMAPYINFDRVEDRSSYLRERAPDHKDFSDTIAELCNRIGCNFLNTFDALKQASASGNHNLYIPNDEHLDVGGHDVVSQVIAGWLRDKNIANGRLDETARQLGEPRR